jgi:septum formation protein
VQSPNQLPNRQSQLPIAQLPIANTITQLLNHPIAQMLILASSSPRRAELLRAAGIPFEVVPASVDESVLKLEPPGEHVRRLAREKADQAFASHPTAVVLAADTIVLIGGETLGKPRDAKDAVRMLRHLSGREHEVLTGVAIVAKRGTVVEVARTRVWINPLSEIEIAEYVATGEPLDKAGAYGIQGLGSRFIDRIQGSYSNVVGLPVALVYRLLKGYPER